MDCAEHSTAFPNMPIFSNSQTKPNQTKQSKAKQSKD
jgi:hypothetical protein